MTREHKLAIILGFSVLLVVGLLVGDHFSKARRPQGGGGAEVVIAPTQPTSQPTTALIDPTAPREPVLTGSTPVPAEPGRGTVTIADSHGGMTVEPIVMGEPRRPMTAAVAPASPVGLSASGTELADLTDRINRLSQTPVDPTAGVAPSGIASAPAPAAAPADKMHPVQAGQTLYSIAKQYYNDPSLWKELAKYNESRVKGDSVRVGVTLRIPSKDVLLGRTPPAGSQTSPSNPTRPSSPSLTPGSSRPTRVTEGDQPVVPNRAVLGAPLSATDTVRGSDQAPKSDRPVEADKPAPVRPKTYTVKPGDTLMQIAARTMGDGKRWRELLSANKDKLDEPEDLQVGMVLKVPAK